MSGNEPKPSRNTSEIKIPAPKEGPAVTCPECKARNQKGSFCSQCSAVLPTGI